MPHWYSSVPQSPLGSASTKNPPPLGGIRATYSQRGVQATFVGGAFVKYGNRAPSGYAGPVEHALTGPESLATVAECGVEPMPNTDISVPGWTYLSNSSRDGSLVWVTKVRPDCSRELHGSLQKGARNETFAQAEVVGEAGADCSR